MTYRADTVTSDELARWLTERYCYYSVDTSGVYRCDVRHAPWQLQAAEAEISSNTLAEQFGIRIPLQTPVAHYARRMDAHICAVRRVRYNTRRSEEEVFASI